MKLTKINILGKIYKIEYCDNPADVDIYKRKSLWGQIDFWTRTIRLYDNGRNEQDLWDTLIHEIIHGIASELNLSDKKISDTDDVVGMLAMGLADVFIRNDLLKTK